MNRSKYNSRYNKRVISVNLAKPQQRWELQVEADRLGCSPSRVAAISICLGLGEIQDMTTSTFDALQHGLGFKP